MIFAGLNPEELCDLMCGEPEKEQEDEDDGHQDGKD